MKESDIVYQNGSAFVFKERGRYNVCTCRLGATHSVSDSQYSLTPDGLSIAKARADYLAKGKQP